MGLEELIKQHQVIVCAGSGGVGKTTLSASLGVKASDMGLNVLVLTIDPAKRLATSLGLENTDGGQVVKVPRDSQAGSLYAGLIKAESAFENFVRRNSPDNAIAERLFKNRLYRQLSSTFSGTQEFTSLNTLLYEAESGKYDLVILDTPPTQHAIDFLQAPEKLYSLFQKSVTQWFVGNTSSGPSWVRRLVNQGTKAVFRALEMVTGSGFISELSDFFQCVQTLEVHISERSRRVHEMLISSETAFVLITGFDETKLAEADYFNGELKKGGYKLEAVIVNRALPSWSGEEVAAQLSGEWIEKYQELQSFFRKFQDFHSERQKKYSEFEKKLKDRVRVVKLPDMNQDIYGLESLGMLARELDRRFVIKSDESLAPEGATNV